MTYNKGQSTTVSIYNLLIYRKRHLVHFATTVSILFINYALRHLDTLRHFRSVSYNPVLA